MNSRCKPGDLAVILYDDLPATTNIGRIVEVRGPAAINKLGQLTWLITPINLDDPYVVESPLGCFRFMECSDRDIEHADDWMIPISTESLAEVFDEQPEFLLISRSKAGLA